MLLFDWLGTLVTLSSGCLEFAVTCCGLVISNSSCQNLIPDTVFLEILFQTCAVAIGEIKSY